MQLQEQQVSLHIVCMAVCTGVAETLVHYALDEQVTYYLCFGQIGHTHYLSTVTDFFFSV